ncbi:heme/hemin ABC transporter substrate-binding protein [Mesorhizobium marinum]|uniref:heme/hemin ABC transporter substrate-binding protein n=1 Tax=Mesorhizobium marinum TaxID=3228790 RepID=UPI003467BAB6
MGRIHAVSRASWACAFIVALGAVAASADDGVFADPSRIAAVGGSVTEIVYALGQEDKLVARDSTSLYPAAALSLPDVGYMRQLSPEGVLSVNPTGILAAEGSGPREAIDVLAKASIPFITVPDSFDHAGILEKIRVVGKALGVEKEATRLAASVDAELVAAEALTKGIPEKKRVLFILSLQGGKILAAGSDTAASGIIDLAGAANAVEGYSGYKQLSDEAAILARPDIVLMMDRGDGEGVSEEEVFAHPAIAPTPAGQARKLIRMDGGYLLGFGPRTAAAIRDLATALYGDQVKG